jgi:hypothetical protein
LAIRIELTSPLSVAATLAALERGVAYWRESEVPSHLKTRGVLGVTVTRRHQSLCFLAEPSNQNRPPINRFLVYVDVAPAGDAGSTVAILVGPSRTFSWFVTAVAALAAWSALTASWPATFVLLGMLALHIGLERWNSAHLDRRSDPVVTHIVDRIEAVIRSAHSDSARAHPVV